MVKVFLFVKGGLYLLVNFRLHLLGVSCMACIVYPNTSYFSVVFMLLPSDDGKKPKVELS